MRQPTHLDVRGLTPDFRDLTNRKAEVAKHGCTLTAAAGVTPPGADVAGSQRLHGKHGGADMASALAHERDAAIPHHELGVRHLRHQGVESDASVAEVGSRDHFLPRQVYARIGDFVDLDR